MSVALSSGKKPRFNNFLNLWALKYYANMTMIYYYILNSRQISYCKILFHSDISYSDSTIKKSYSPIFLARLLTHLVIKFLQKLNHKSMSDKLATTIRGSISSQDNKECVNLYLLINTLGTAINHQGLSLIIGSI